MKTSMIVGGAGFIGSHLCRKLLNKGHRVICIDNMITGNIDHVDKLKKYKNFIYYKSLYEIFSISHLRYSINDIYYLASIASPKLYLKYPFETIEANTSNAMEYLRYASTVGAKFLYTSSSEVYGFSLDVPFRESNHGDVDTMADRAVYEESKRMGETIVETFRRYRNVNTRIVRLFNCYGPGMSLKDGRVVPNFISQALNNDDITIYDSGNQTRSFCYIDDTIMGILKVMECESKNCHDPFNIGNPKEYYTIKEVANKIKKFTKSSSNIIHTTNIAMCDPFLRKPDISKIHHETRWRPKVSFTDGLMITINAMRKANAKKSCVV